jgi:hypothetical protein
MELEPSRRRASLRASDADREQIVFALRQHHGDGRLTVSEFTERMSVAYEAKTLGDLDGLTRDLPPLPPPLPDEPRPDPVGVVRGRFYRHLLSYACVNAFMILLWVVTSLAVGRILFFWPAWTLLGWGIAVGSHAIRTFGPQEVRHPHDHPGGPWDRRHHDPSDRRNGRGPDDPRRPRSRPQVYR